MARTMGPVEMAREASGRRDWAAAASLFSKLADEALSPEDLEAKAEAYWWTCNIEQSMTVRAKAYAALAQAGSRQRAAYNAWFLSADYRQIGEQAVSNGWLQRARRDLDGLPECVEHAYLALADADDAGLAGDLTAAAGLAQAAIDIGTRISDPGIVALGRAEQGRFHVQAGRVREGTRLMDEAMTSVVTGVLDPLATGWIFCSVLRTSWGIGDLRRAAEWTDAATRWYQAFACLGPYRPTCRIHRVDVAMLRGEWDRAVEDAQRAREEMELFAPWAAAGAVYAIGEISRRRGDLPDAEKQFAEAHRLGHEPQPGMSLLRLAQGDPRAAAAGLRLPLAEDEVQPMPRSMLLAAHVEVALANGDLASATTACKELDQLAEQWDSPMLWATAWMCCSARQLAEGDADAALTSSHRAVKLLRELKLPYEEALARTLLGIASQRIGDEERARLEIEAARDQLERLGAKRDAQRVAALLATGDEPPAGLSDREVEVLRLVAAGKTNREIAADMVLSEHTVSRHLQNIFRKLDVSTRSAATAFAFEHDLV